MPKTKISEYSATANSNTDVASINIDEGCAPSGINNAIRAVMGHLKDFQQGTNGDPFNGPVNGTVGATTPSTGAFTTLSASSTVTLSGGTANGVAYLNGSKVLTTGSALTFNGSALAVAGTISSNNGSANNLLSINGDGAIQSGVQFKANGAGPYTTIYFDNATNHTYYKNLASGGHLFFNNSTQAMTLDANGVLVAGRTSSPGNARLGIAGNSDTTNGLNISYSGVGEALIRVVSGGALTFGYDGANGATERARIDSSGNLIQTGVTTASGMLMSALGSSSSNSTTNSATYNITIVGSAKVFWVYTANGDGCLVVTNYTTSTITIVGTGGVIVASASPASNQLGISKSINSHVVTFKTGSAASTTWSSWGIGSLSSTVA